MTLDDKRKVIEALLCAGGDDNRVSSLQSQYDTECNEQMLDHAINTSYYHHQLGSIRFGDRLTDAAYRLIESSPTLRREWFRR